MAGAAAQMSGMEPIELRAPLFESLIGGLDETRRHVVIDLSPARSTTIDLLSRFRCRLDVIDLPRALDEIGSAEEKDLPDLFRSLLTPPRGETVDVVLCWQLLNYLEPAAIEALMRCLARRGGARTRIHALIEYSATRMPQTPGFIAPMSSDTLMLMPSQAELRPTPRYSSPDLEKCMPGFSHERTMLLGNGMQEYLFRASGS